MNWKVDFGVLVLCLFVLLLEHPRGSAGMQLDLYTEKFRLGEGITLEVSESDCTKVPQQWLNVTMSVDTHDRCMQFYRGKLCKGKMAELQPFHIIHQMDLSLIDFEDAIRSISPCGDKVQSGRYVIQSMVDATVLTTSKFEKDIIANGRTLPARPFIPKTQQWEITETNPMEYDIMPRDHEENVPVTYDSAAAKNRLSLIRNVWRIESVGSKRYVFRNERSGKCLYKSWFQTLEEVDCRAWSPNQEWIVRPLQSFQKLNSTNSIVPSIHLEEKDRYSSSSSVKYGRGKHDFGSKISKKKLDMKIIKPFERVTPPPPEDETTTAYDSVRQKLMSYFSSIF